MGKRAKPEEIIAKLREVEARQRRGERVRRERKRCGGNSGKSHHA